MEMVVRAAAGIVVGIVHGKGMFENYLNSKTEVAEAFT